MVYDKKALFITIILVFVLVFFVFSNSVGKKVDTPTIRGMMKIHYLNYFMDDGEKKIKVNTYQNIAKYFQEIDDPLDCGLFCPTPKETHLKFIDNEFQKTNLQPIIEELQKTSPNPDVQARAAISLVQNIPFDQLKTEKKNPRTRFPYQVIHDNLGLCGEKSKLLVLILKEMGYATSLFIWDGVHEAVGVSCPPNQQYANTGYCFIETTFPIIPTHKPTQYGIYDRLSLDDNPQVIPISKGKSLDLSEEYQDAQTWKQLEQKVTQNPTLSESDYQTYYYLAGKYNIQLE